MSSLLQEAAAFYGRGKEQKTAKGWLSLCPVHDDHKPSLSLWTDSKGQVAGRCLAGCDPKEVYRQLVDDGFILPVTRVLKKKQVGKWLSPVPVDAPPPPEACYLGKPHGNQRATKLWALTDPQGHTLLYEGRFDVLMKDGGREKVYRRLAYYEANDGSDPGWAWVEPQGELLPLYGLNRLKDGQDILVCEGCKSADAAQKLFPSLSCLGWVSGALRWRDSDWAQLPAGSNITLWPDSDKDGERSCTGPGSLPLSLRAMGHSVFVVPAFKEPLPKGWDLADPLPADWDGPTVPELYDSALEVKDLEEAFLEQYCLVAARGEGLPRRCGLAEGCQDCLQLGRRESPEEILNTDRLSLEWVYVDQQVQWYNVYDGRLLRKDGFNQSLAREGYELSGKYSASNSYLADPSNTFVFDLDFWPGKPVTFPDELERTRVNTWRQWLTRPKEGEPGPWLELLESLAAEEWVREHLVKWLAFTVQHPERKINYGLLLISNTQGVGKDSLLYPVEQTMGRAARNIQADVLGRDSDEYLMGTKLLVIQELNLYGRRGSLYDKLKPVLAAPPRHLMVNRKYIKEFEIHNMVNVVAFSNHDRPLNIEDKDRRLMVYRVSERTFGQKWFTEYYRWVDQEDGYRQVYGYLLDQDLSDFNHGGHAPMTKDKEDLIKMSNPILEEVRGLIEERLPPFHGDLFTVAELQERLAKEGYRMSTVKLSRLLLQLNDHGVIKLKLVQSKRDQLRVNLWACRHWGEWNGESDPRLIEAWRRREEWGQEPGDLPLGPDDDAELT